MKNIRNILSFLLVIPLAAQATEQSSDVESLDALRAFIEVYEHIKGEYVEEIDDQTLLNDAINGMLTKLDPHSGYLKPRDVSSLRDSNIWFIWRNRDRNGRDRWSHPSHCTD